MKGDIVVRPKGATHILVMDDKYAGKYVATPSFNNKKVIAVGDTLHATWDLAHDRGYNNPVVFHVPNKDSVCLY